MIPALENSRYIRAFAGVRPLVNLRLKDDDRALSRGFFLMDHEEDGVKNLVTITGGKLTTYRHMAEKVSDLVCRKLGVAGPCKTLEIPLASTDAGSWTRAGFAARQWLSQGGRRGPLLCECEIQPVDILDSIINSLHDCGDSPDISSISVRSRIGKGSCQGTICGLRLMIEMVERGELDVAAGIGALKDFLRERWKGERPVLWGSQLRQAELKEAIYCGTLGLEKDSF
jgi:glycerol-3-phosphate dehydrogenase